MTIVSKEFKDMSVRGTGVGRMIMEEAIRIVEEGILHHEMIREPSE